MALTQAYSGVEAALGTTEWSLPRDAAYSSASPTVDTGIFQLFLDLSDMIAGDEVEIKIYEKVLSTESQKLVWQAVISGSSSDPIFVTPALALMHGWDITAKAVSGAVAIVWSIRKVA